MYLSVITVKLDKSRIHVLNIRIYSNKNVDIKFSVHDDTFLEEPSSGMLIIEISEYTLIIKTQISNLVEKTFIIYAQNRKIGKPNNLLLRST